MRDDFEGSSDIELDLEEYAGYSVDMQSLKKGASVREACGQQDGMKDMNANEYQVERRLCWLCV